MSRPGKLRASDVRAAYLLAGECRELGDDPVIWRQHFLTGLARMTGAGFGVSAEIGDGKQASRYDLGTIDSGDGKGFDRAGWLRMLGEFQTNAFFNPFMNAYFGRATPGTCHARNDLVPDREWYRSFYYRGFRLTLGADASLLCLRPIPGTRDDHAGLYLLRPIGERNFGGRDRAIALEAMAAVVPLIGGPLARFADPSPSALSPRLRQVLKCVLEGDSDKLVAARLGLSRYTVNEYVEGIFRHFGVRSRPELLARWVRRGWGGRFAWADLDADSD
jgi:DNA-binding CsgD family transcriptional regulator